MIAQVISSEPDACIVVKSTIPVGFIDDVRERLKTDAVIFSPELKTRRSMIICTQAGSLWARSRARNRIANLLAQCAIKTDIDLLFTGACEAEAIKLFSNTYLAMRVAFFNELDMH